MGPNKRRTMTELALCAIDLCNTLAQKSELTDYEKQLYEAAAKTATTILRFQDACQQAALMKAEQELHEQCTRGRAG
jgi:hypothetical protein